MKLLEVDKFLKISIKKQELADYSDSLNNIIAYFDDDNDIPEDIPTLKNFFIELQKILIDSRDY